MRKSPCSDVLTIEGNCFELGEAQSDNCRNAETGTETCQDGFDETSGDWVMKEGERACS